MLDLLLISGSFFDAEISHNKRYLLYYFRTELQIAFLRYYLVFKDTKMFQNHTGFYCSERLRYRLLCRAKRLIKLHDESKKSLTEEGMETLQLIESGKYPLTGNDFC